ncbi:hypothetical protein ABKV19_008143 [Rosa sericea]
MQVPRWRNVLILRNSLISMTCTPTHLASFHSTPASCEKWKDKWNFEEDDSGSSPKNHRSKSCRHAQKSHHKKMKRKLKRESFSDDENHPETIFQATYGKRWYTWSFNSQRDSFHDSASGFEWREPSSWKDKSKRWENISDVESDDEQCTIGSCSDRKILGLPSTGPLKTEDVKKAFHLSALKWHPDKHQGSSQEMAAEKFRLCVNAYNSLCNALSAA